MRRNRGAARRARRCFQATQGVALYAEMEMKMVVTMALEMTVAAMAAMVMVACYGV